MAKTMINQYEVRSKLGRGGMANVVLAFDTHLEREVAIKLLDSYFARDASFSARFEREAKAITSLEHSHIVPVYDYGHYKGLPFLVMRYMKGGSLGKHLQKGALSVGKASRIIERIASALDHAHANGLVHRDLKPDNILFDQDGLAFLGDFGIVKIAESSTTYTQTGSTLGTPAYMSPEQAKAMGEIDGRSDIYSLGVIMYETLTGDIPYKSDTTLGQAMMHVLEPVPRILEANSDLPPFCDEIIQKAMAKDPNDRYATATELVRDLYSVARTRGTMAMWGVTADLPSLPTPPKPEPVAETSATPDPEPDTAQQAPADVAEVVEEEESRSTAVVLPLEGQPQRSPTQASQQPPRPQPRPTPPVETRASGATAVQPAPQTGGAQPPQRRVPPLVWAGGGLFVLAVILAIIFWPSSPEPPIVNKPTDTPTATSTRAVDEPIITITPTSSATPTPSSETLPPTLTPTHTPSPTWTPTPTTSFIAADVVVTNLNLNNSGNSLTISPGSEIIGTLNYEVWSQTNCPGCEIQIVIGINGDAQDCAYHDKPGIYPGEAGNGDFRLTAPTTPGTYEIRYQMTFELSCADGQTRYEDRTNQSLVIGVITVEDPYAIDPNMWYRLSNRFRNDGEAVDCCHPEGNPFVIDEGNFTGQYWRFMPLGDG